MDRLTILNLTIAALLIAQGIFWPPLLPKQVTDAYAAKLAHLVHRQPATPAERQPLRFSF
jgi:hypothetical protein